jgi:hypothetical protein
MPSSTLSEQMHQKQNWIDLLGMSSSVKVMNLTRERKELGCCTVRVEALILSCNPEIGIVYFRIS